MRRTIPLLLFIVITLAVVPSSIVKAQGPSEKRSLQGLTSINVLLESLDEDVERLGLTKEQLQTDAELKLRKAGVHVASDSEAIKDSNIGLLYINVGTHPNRVANGLYAFSVSVELRQTVKLERDTSITVFLATTYRTKEHFGTVGAEHLRDQLRASINDKVDVFLNDYLAMNPK